MPSAQNSVIMLQVILSFVVRGWGSIALSYAARRVSVSPALVTSPILMWHWGVRRWFFRFSSSLLVRLSLLWGIRVKNKFVTGYDICTAVLCRIDAFRDVIENQVS